MKVKSAIKYIVKENLSFVISIIISTTILLLYPNIFNMIFDYASSLFNDEEFSNNIFLHATALGITIFVIAITIVFLAKILDFLLSKNKKQI
ncbi:hypothetical protein LPB90_18345 [Chryseobacterium sp. LC2016-29]|uniref:hypothetical protein n=1 Tax=Chryseobacterium sp. LC2016-29 TaxID=2897331 RepID=UPI001E326A6D|nr:hypothetical protein [Chryseobacterium sp. LC2016-29]MCD0480403.1 hypothetical protein [Chryseobacterium sp. LC2016-29]